MADTFAGAIPELYDRYLGPTMFEPYAIELAGRVPKQSRRVLEIAAGTGRLTRHLLDNLARDGTIVATDLESAMLDQARRKLPMDPRLHLQTADAQALPFPEGRFDAVACQFGLMFVPDKALALREMYRVLQPGGTLLLSTWNGLAANPANQVLDELVRAALGVEHAFSEVPFSLHDAAALRDLAIAAGFDTMVHTVERTGEAKSAAFLANGFVRGNPLANTLSERGLDPAEMVAKVEAALRDRFGEPPAFPLSAHVVVATKR